MLPTTLILLAVAFPLIALILLFLGSLVGSRGNGVGVAQFAYLGAVLSLGIVLVQYVTGACELPLDLSVGEVDTWSVFPRRTQLMLHVDLLSISWMLLSSALIGALLSGTVLSAPVMKRSSVLLTLGLLASQFGVMLLADVWWQWICLSSGSCCLFGVLWSEQPTEKRSACTSTLVTLLAADLFWMLGMLGLFQILDSYAFRELIAPSRVAELSQYQRALFGVAGMWLLGSLLVRSIMFPAMGFSTSVTHKSRGAMWLCLPLITSLFLLLRFMPLLGSDVGLRTFMGGIATLSMLFLPLMTLGNQTAGHRLLRLTSASLSLVWICLAAEPTTSVVMLRYAVSLLACTVVIGLSLEQPQHQLLRKCACVAAVLWGSGLLGQGFVLKVLGQVSQTPGSVTLPGSVPTLVLFAHGLISFGLYRLVFPLKSESKVLAPVIRTSIIFSLGFLLVPVLWLGWVSYQAKGVESFAPRCLLFAAFGATIALLTERQLKRSPEQAIAPRALERLSEKELYGPLLIQVLFVFPIQFLVRIISLIEAEAFQKTLPKAWGLFQSQHAEQRADTPHSSQLGTIVMTILVMGTALLLADLL